VEVSKGGGWEVGRERGALLEVELGGARRGETSGVGVRGGWREAGEMEGEGGREKGGRRVTFEKYSKKHSDKISGIKGCNPGDNLPKNLATYSENNSHADLN
jgi:hypothetical protein